MKKLTRRINNIRSSATSEVLKVLKNTLKFKDNYEGKNFSLYKTENNKLVIIHKNVGVVLVTEDAGFAYGYLAKLEGEDSILGNSDDTVIVHHSTQQLNDYIDISFT